MKLGKLMIERNAMDQSARTIQAAYRGGKGRKDANDKLERAFEERKRHRAARGLQSIARSKSARMRAADLRRQRDEETDEQWLRRMSKARELSAVKIQATTRSLLAKWAYQHTRDADERARLMVVRIQTAWRAHFAKEKYRRYRAREVEAEARIQRLEAAARERRSMELRAATALRRQQAMERARREVRALGESQRRKMRTEQDAASTLVQSIFRGAAARDEFQRLRKEFNAKILSENANMIQNVWRNRAGRKRIGRLMKMYDAQLKEKSAIIIQQQARGQLARWHFKHASKEAKELDAAIMIQSAWRARRGRKEYAAILAERQAKIEEAAAIVVQSAWRAKQARGRVKDLKAEKQAALEEQMAIRLQCIVSTYC